MNSITKLWPDFDIEEGFIDFENFSVTLRIIAQDQGVYDDNISAED